MRFEGGAPVATIVARELADGGRSAVVDGVRADRIAWFTTVVFAVFTLIESTSAPGP